MSEPSYRSESTPPATESGDREDHDDHGDHGDRPPPRKRQRVRLSCLECRRRKLSCDRELPCSRCLQSGTADRCEYETRPGLAPPNKLGLSQSALTGFDSRLSLPGTAGDLLLHRKDAREAERIRRLELEVAQLKGMLAKQISASVDGSTVVDQSPASIEKPETGPELEILLPSCLQVKDPGADKEVRFYRGQEFKNRYFGPHSAFIAFIELTGLCPFMKETSVEWLQPLHVHNKKDRKKRAEDREAKFRQPDPVLEVLLPSKDETDAFVSIYLDQFEQIHRIIHIPSFRRAYAKFWDPAEPRSAASTALILSILGVACCLNSQLPQKFDKMVSNTHSNAVKWIEAVDEWQNRQSQKHRRLIHYQIACLVYLAKKINTIKKKRFWKGAGAMSQDAISVALHRDPTLLNNKMSPFTQEMRRRIWATIQSYDIQAAFDFCLPTIHGTLSYDVEPPRNIDDEEFDEDSEELPPSKPTTEYTFTSYQHLSRQSLPLRLQLSKVLNAGVGELDYDQVIRYTNEINQEIDSLPSWDVNEGGDGEVAKKPLLAYTLLHIELRQYIIPLHQPFLRLRKTHSRYQYSEIIYYNAARDMVLLLDKIGQQGIRTLNFMREDSLTLAINLCSVTMLQPRGSTNMIMINSQHTLQLLEKCLGMKEDRMLRCGNNEPWSYSIMCAAAGLLETHLGTKTAEVAKAAAAERFISLHYKLLACQDPPVSSQQSQLSGGEQQQLGGNSKTTPSRTGTPFQHPPSSLTEMFNRSKSVTPFPSGSQGGGGIPLGSTPGALFGGGTTGQTVEVPGTPWWLPNSGDPSAVSQMQLPCPTEFTLESLGLNLNELWGADQFENWDGSWGGE
ncbi:hypothetical protein B0H66DRAFT_318372 [Apodospora peruviana]|uniref:Zn(2)-C6 fungal-type domain-containing protein n=1 Tax=Apodospora peruviana TaxID=516989 RepID=A0AAE0HXF5_9PEZI|nr:hypothetical protein B0H66DRAFT_318372 [Apodospora peruviana]